MPPKKMVDHDPLSFRRFGLFMKFRAPNGSCPPRVMPPCTRRVPEPEPEPEPEPAPEPEPEPEPAPEPEPEPASEPSLVPLSVTPPPGLDVMSPGGDAPPNSPDADESDPVVMRMRFADLVSLGPAQW